MNTPLPFPIDDKTIYQMGLNPGPSHSTTTYVPEPPSTASLTNQLLGMLNPQTNQEDRSRMFGELMVPHYQKQDEILERLSGLTTMVKNFIDSQQSINEFVFDKLFKSVNSTPPGIEKINGRTNDFVGLNSPKPRRECCDASTMTDEVKSTEPRTSPSRVGSIALPVDQPLDAKMSVRDFLKNTLTVVKRENEDDDDEEEDNRLTTEKYNKFRVRNPPKKVKRIEVSYASLPNQTFRPTDVQTTSATKAASQSPVCSSLTAQPSVEQNLSDNSNDMCAFKSPQMENQTHKLPDSVQVEGSSSSSSIDMMLMNNPIVPTSSFSFNHQQPQSAPAPLFAPGLTDAEKEWIAAQIPQPQSNGYTNLESDFRPQQEQEHPSNFRPYMSSTNELHHTRSAFVPHFHKERQL